MARNSRMRAAACVALSLALALGLTPARAGATDPAAPASADATATQVLDSPAPTPDATATPDAPATSDADTPATGQPADADAIAGDESPTDAAPSSTQASAAEKSLPSQDATASAAAAPAVAATEAAGLAVASEQTPEGDPEDSPDEEPDDGLHVQSSPLVDGTTKDVSRTSTLASFTTGGTANVAHLQTTALYRLSVVGAHGGNWVWGSKTTYGGSGGSTTAVTPIDAGAFPNLYVVCGGRGVDATNMSEHPGGANGGGNGGAGARRDNVNYHGGGSGGGASHIATQGDSLPEFGTAANVEASVLVIAGGGGGCGGGNESGKNYTGGAGGGVKGGNGGVFSGSSMAGGSQAANSGSKMIGQGTNGAAGNNTDHGAEGHGGGGGGYWGGAAKTSRGKSTKASGAGGSGYLNGSLLQGSKASDGGSMEWGGQRVASTAAGVGGGEGTASVEYVASIVTLDNHDANEPGTQSFFAAPASDAYYTAYSIDGLNTPVEQIEVPVRDGWAFKGYYTQPDGAGERYVDEDGAIETGLYAEGTVTLHAWWWPIVSFDENGVDAQNMPDDIVVRPGETATRPSDPEADGHGFKGWSTDYTLYREFDFTKPVTEPVSLYAFWSPHVEFDLRGHGDEIEPQFLQRGASGQKATRPDDPTEGGYTFGGWFTSPSFAPDTEFDFDAEVTTDTTLYAKWSANEYSVEFVNDGNVVGSEDFVYDTDEKPLLTASELNISRDGWSFAGWREGEELQVDFEDGQEVRNLSTETGVLEFHAVWQRDITFHAADVPGLTQSLASASGIALKASADENVAQLTDGATYSQITAPTLPSIGTWRGVGWVASQVPASAADVAAGDAFMPMATEFFGLYHRDVRVAFDGNGAEAGSVADLADLQRMNASGQISSVTFVLPQNGFTWEWHSFRTWDLGKPGDAITLSPAATESPNKTALALWDELPRPPEPPVTPDEPSSPETPPTTDGPAPTDQNAPASRPANRRSSSPATGDMPAWPAAALVALSAAAIAAGIARRPRRGN